MRVRDIDGADIEELMRRSDDLDADEKKHSKNRPLERQTEKKIEKIKYEKEIVKDKIKRIFDKV